MNESYHITATDTAAYAVEAHRCALPHSVRDNGKQPSASLWLKELNNKIKTFKGCTDFKIATVAKVSNFLTTLTS